MAQSSWATYRRGTITNKVMAEMKKVADNKDYRKKTVESGTMASIKSTPMAIYATLNALEGHIEYRDAVSKATYENTIKSVQGVNTQIMSVKQQVGQVQQSIKGIDVSVKSNLSRTETSLLKAIKQEAHLIQKVRENIVNMAAVSGGMKGNLDDGAIRADIKKATKLLKQSTSEELRGNRDQILKTLQKRDEAFVKAVADQYKALVSDMAKTLGGTQVDTTQVAPAPSESDRILRDDVLPVLNDELLPIIRDDVRGALPEIVGSIATLDKKFSPMVSQIDSIDRAVDPLASQVEGITENVEIIGDRLESQREDVGKQLKETREHITEGFDTMGGKLDSQKEEVGKQLKETHEHITEGFDTVGDKFDSQKEEVGKQLKNNHEALLNVFGANLETIVATMNDQIDQLRADEAELNAAQTQVVADLLKDLAGDIKGMKKDLGALKKDVAALKKK